MHPVTIDKLDIKSHERYAQDQQKLDPKYITDSRSIGNYFEIAGVSKIYPSQFEELFELEKRNLPWALFEPPCNYTLQSNRFFSYSLLPSICLSHPEEDEDSEEEVEEDEEKKRKEQTRMQFMTSIQRAQRDKKQSLVAFENEKSTLISLVESIHDLDSILSQINSRKRQYQKG